MEQADFSYGMVSDAAGLSAAVSIFANRPNIRAEAEEDLRAVGFRIGHSGALDALVDGEVTPLGDVVVLDCPQVDAAGMAALSRLDMRIAKSGAQLVVTTTLDALDDVFACFDQSAPQILVDAGRAERVVAVGRTLGDVAGGRIRELADEDRLALLRLAEQVDTIAKRLEGLSYVAPDGEESISKLSDMNIMFKGADREAVLHRKGQPRIPLPDPRLVRQIIARRQARARFFDAELFADPAWDMLLDLTAAHAEHGRVSVTSLCIASGVPATTALRWIRQMTDSGLFERVEDSADRRRAFITLSDGSVDAMARYFAEVGKPSLAYAA